MATFATYKWYTVTADRDQTYGGYVGRVRSGGDPILEMRGYGDPCLAVGAALRDFAKTHPKEAEALAQQAIKLCDDGTVRVSERVRGARDLDFSCAKLTKLYRKYVGSGEVDAKYLREVLSREIRQIEAGTLRATSGLLSELRADRAKAGALAKRCKG